MTFHKNIWLEAGTLSQLRTYLSKEPESPKECLGEDETITFTADFGKGIQMDVKVCGVQYEEGGCNTAWSEAVLFENGSQVAYSDAGEEIDGSPWELEYEGNLYVVHVLEKPENLSIDEFMDYTSRRFHVGADAMNLIRNILQFFSKRPQPPDQLVPALMELLDDIGYESEELEAIRFDK